MKKRLFPLALCLLLSLTLLLTPALAVAEKPANGYVGDYADVLSASLEQDIIQRNQTLFARTGAEIVVVSVEFMDGLDAESYAYACFDEWGIGDAERNNGLLLVFATDDYTSDNLKRCWAMKGVGLSAALNDSTLNGWLEDYFYTDFDNDNYDAAVEKFFNAAYSWMESYYAGTGNTGTSVVPVPGGQSVQPSGGGIGPMLGSLVVFTVFILIAVTILIAVGSALRSGFYSYYDPYRPRVYRPWPIFFWRPRPPAPPKPPSPRPPSGGSPRPPSGGSFFSGGTSRGGGAGRRGSGTSTSFRSSGGSSFRSGGGSFRSGGGTRSGGAGRR